MKNLQQEKGKLSIKNDLEPEIKSKTEAHSSNQGCTLFHQAEDWITNKYEIRLNTISQEFECRKIGCSAFTPLNENDLYVEINKDNINISIHKLQAILRSNYTPKYNPVNEYFASLKPWDGETDHISALINHLELALDQQQHSLFIQFKKWMVRTVKCASIDGYFNKQAFILSDDGMGQNIGKSSFLRFLCPPSLQNYYTENLTGNDKDDIIQLSKNLFINLDELAGLQRKELTKIKSSMSIANVNVRLPYDRTNSSANRIASFFGSTNETSFLFDQTGSVRWICFVIKNINFKYLHEIDIDAVWAQAFALSNDPTFIAEMTQEELMENEIRNRRFYAMSVEEELIIKYFKVPLDRSGPNVSFKTATEILSFIKNKESLIPMTRSVVNIGKYMTRLAFSKTKQNGIQKYIVEEI